FERERRAMPHSPGEERAVRVVTQLDERTRDRDAAPAERLDPAAVLGDRILAADDDARDPRLAHRGNAWRRAALVQTRLQRDVHRRAGPFAAELVERDALRVFGPRRAMRAFGDDLSAFVDDHATDDRIRRGPAAILVGELERAVHERLVTLAKLRTRSRHGSV